MTEQPIHLTLNELQNLNRIFDILGEEALKANFFTKQDIEDIYSVMVLQLAKPLTTNYTGQLETSGVVVAVTSTFLI